MILEKIIILFSFFININSVYAGVAADGIVAKCQVTPEIKDLEHEPDKFNTTNDLRRITGSFEAAEGENITIYGRLMDKNCVPISDAKLHIWQTNSKGQYQFSPLEKKKPAQPQKILKGDSKTKNKNSAKEKDKRNLEHLLLEKTDHNTIDHNTNHNIKKHSSEFGKLDNHNIIESYYDQNFAGSGTGTTNNMGHFNFLSILPGKYQGNLRHINILVTHPDLKNFTTKIYFIDPSSKVSEEHFANHHRLSDRLVATRYNDDSDASGHSLVNNETVSAGGKIYLFDIVLDQTLTNKGY